MQQTLITHRGHWSSRILTELFSPLHIVCFQLCLNVVYQFVSLDLRQSQVDDALDTEGQSQHQCQSHQRHEAHVTIDELGLQLLMQSAISLFAFGIVKIIYHDGLCSHRVDGGYRISHNHTILD